MSSTRADLNTGTALVTKVLVPYNQKPGEGEIAGLVDALLSHGEFLLADVAQVPEAAAALDDWHTLATGGPEDNPMGNWNYARGLARTIRTLHRVLVSRTGDRLAFVSRPGLPPLAPERAAGHPL
ncbi:DUF6415 family natural product biosynthesis protein [Streptomyces sp. APSN-46.1]|uniref:DUF6415 family natural product biosynthesis protein n=1 Tax=Streptomyces sp. APSN-46.1 TaxID=2929049 RepID=UPI001FB2658D|nr:DUF6415 family natural product biosynthesis protein [Streptomyces sp. APSN-46.1]MCJ1680861.1 DUF6415 family natural product biosynthesis protein [Streptomyces sp. APSN-46.1]